MGILNKILTYKNFGNLNYQISEDSGKIGYNILEKLVETKFKNNEHFKKILSNSKLITKFKEILEFDLMEIRDLKEINEIRFKALILTFFNENKEIDDSFYKTYKETIYCEGSNIDCINVFFDSNPEYLFKIRNYILFLNKSITQENKLDFNIKIEIYGNGAKFIYTPSPIYGFINIIKINFEGSIKIEIGKNALFIDVPIDPNISLLIKKNKLLKKKKLLINKISWLDFNNKNNNNKEIADYFDNTHMFLREIKEIIICLKILSMKMIINIYLIFFLFLMSNDELIFFILT